MWREWGEQSHSGSMPCSLPFHLWAWQPLKNWAWALRLEGWREGERALPLKPFLFPWHWADPPSTLGWNLGSLTVVPALQGIAV